MEESNLSSEGEVVFCRQSGVGTEDDWDDTALIEAYDRAVGCIYKELDKRKASRKGSVSLKWRTGEYCRSQYSEDGVWYEAKILSICGDLCTVQYLGYLNEEEKSLDSLRKSRGDTSRQLQISEANGFEDVVKEAATDRNRSRYPFSKPSALGNKAKDNVIPSTSGLKDRLISSDEKEAQPATSSLQYRSLKDNEHERRKRGAFLHESGPGIAFPPPPPPFPPHVDGICSSDEALAAMLMSWYISGYHTGYYQAMRQSGGSS
ncbi:survival motor neuron protein-like [Varroa jacobsoni]|uniref:Tudor domain-containing protein n=1 Tax=Varroa destructor TaxID=109461 RepID=A0A7M7JB22_VARDE|nr:survival motor neuron protein-like [Varroa destructor]XP_022707847.1 survival motor neuron protein-like [Varroa jacobsoni]